VKSSQFLRPLFEFSGACAGCGETPYLKLLTQLFGDRAIIANATGCSSIYGGNLPTTPYCTDRCGRGPAWANSLFEDNAEFGLGIRLAVDQQRARARARIVEISPTLPSGLADALLNAEQDSEAGIAAQRARVDLVRPLLGPLADYLVEKSVWIVGGDGWAYDIGFGGLDHVLASGANVKMLVLDTEVYSNTGGQQSKATPTGASAKFAAAGKGGVKKDLGLMAMAYGHVYVAQVALGARDSQTLKAFLEAESYPGPSLIIAYGHCIAHGYDMAFGLEHQKLAANSGYWPLYRFDPRRAAAGEPPLVIDSTAPKVGVDALMALESRFQVIKEENPERYRELASKAQEDVDRRFALYRTLASAQTRQPAERVTGTK
jgi:pyruvate-ferredoxin/flavodoxin oxidoreductase